MKIVEIVIRTLAQAQDWFESTSGTSSSDYIRPRWSQKVFRDDRLGDQYVGLRSSYTLFFKQLPAKLTLAYIRDVHKTLTVIVEFILRQ